MDDSAIPRLHAVSPFRSNIGWLLSSTVLSTLPESGCCSIAARSPLPEIKEAVNYVAEFHIADAPGRHEPSEREIGIPAAYETIRDTGFSNGLTFEQDPSRNQTESVMKSAKEMRAAFD